MTDERVQRRLAAILAADIVGYSRLMEADEVGTLRRLEEVRAGVFDPAVARFGGRLVKTTGDGALVEFPSAVDAVCCAVAVQSELAAGGAATPGASALRYRIGVHLGDVIVVGDDVFGEGVNIAARLEGLAPAGGVAISGGIREHILGKVAAAFTDAGERQVKNMSRPIRVWQWQPDGPAAPAAVAASAERRVVAGQMPRVAVVRFATGGGSLELEDFAESLADDLTTALSTRRGIEVIARGVTADPDTVPGDVPETWSANKADYLLTGALRRSGGRIRITAQLVDVHSGAQFWADRYDREWGDTFALVDELTERIAIAARTAMNAYDGRRYEDSPDSALGNAELRARAARHFYKFTRADYLAAGRLLDSVLENDPEDAMALAMQAFCLWYLGNFDLHEIDPRTRDCIVDLARRAVELDRHSDYVCRTRGMVALYLLRDTATALADAERALALSPQYGLGLHLKAEALIYGGRPAEGIALMRKLIGMDARDPINYFRNGTLAMGHFAAGDYEAALAAIDDALLGATGWPDHDLAKAAVLAMLARTDEARRIVDDLRARWPDAAIGTIRIPPYKVAEYRARYADALRAAGLPD